MALQKIKLDKKYAWSVFYGDKSFEVRFNDRQYGKGDIVQFQVVDGNTPIDHPLNKCSFIITYILSDYGLKNGYVVFGIKKL